MPLKNLNFGAFLGNFFFLQTILCETFGSNGPLWSLANEFWYYALFPVALAAGLAFARHRLRTAILLTCLALLIGIFVGRAILIGFLIWLAGTALVFLNSKIQLHLRSTALVVLSLFSVLAGVSLAVARVRQWDPLFSDLELGLVFTLFLFALLQYQAGQDSSPYSGIAHRFAGFSYSLYVLHFPLLLFFRSWLVPPERWQPTPLHLLSAGGVGALCLLYAWLISRATEAKTDDARRWVQRRM